MNDLARITILAIVQGFTEFLPVSSSGHLVLVNLISGGASANDLAEVVVVLHLGTLLSICVFYFARIRKLFGQDRRVIALLAVGTVPAVVIGLPAKLFAESLFESPLLTGCLLLATGGLLIYVGRRKPAEGEYQKLSWVSAIWIGVAQALAIFPGLSRSGSTIAAGIGSNLSPQSAATFSFLLAIPAIAGGGLLESRKLFIGDATMTTSWTLLLTGAAVAFVVGLFSLWWLDGWLQKGRLHWFAWWCIPLGLVVIGASLLGWT